MSFHSGNFIFDNISNSSMGVIRVDFESDILKDYGVEYDTEIEVDYSINSYEPVPYGQTPKVSDIELTLCRVNEFNEPISWTREDVINITRWLNQEDYKPFETEDTKDIIYYLKCKGIKKQLDPDLKGVYTFVMQPSSNFAYSPIVNHMQVNTQVGDIVPITSLTVTNTTNVLQKYYPEITLTCNNSVGEMKVVNRTTGQELIVVGLSMGEELKIDCLYKSVISSTGASRVMNTNREWIYLKQGDNILEFIGAGGFNVKTQFPIIV